MAPPMPAPLPDLGEKDIAEPMMEDPSFGLAGEGAPHGMNRYIFPPTNDQLNPVSGLLRLLLNRVMPRPQATGPMRPPIGPVGP